MLTFVKFVRALHLTLYDVTATMTHHYDSSLLFTFYDVTALPLLETTVRAKVKVKPATRKTILTWW